MKASIGKGNTVRSQHQVGSLEVGKKADVILIDFDKPHLTPMTFVPQLLTYYVNGNDVDTVLVDGKVLGETLSLGAAIAPYMPGQTITLRILRGDHVLTLEATLREFPAS